MLLLSLAGDELLSLRGYIPPTHLIPVSKSVKASLGTDRNSFLHPFQRSGQINLCSEVVKYTSYFFLAWVCKTTECLRRKIVAIKYRKTQVHMNLKALCQKETLHRTEICRGNLCFQQRGNGIEVL